jgi:hypothetical protein
MLGELALSERAIADHSILTLGSATADANFTLGQAGTYIGVDAAEMNAVAVKVSVGSGILTGLIDATLEFTQSSALTRFATGVSAQVLTAVQTSNALYVARGISDQDAQFIQDSAAVAIVSGISEQDANFTESANANMLYSGIPEMSAEFIQSLLAGVISNNPASIEAVFVQATEGSKVILSGPAQIDAAFIQTTEGRLYWDVWTGGPTYSPQENWVQIVPAGGTWTEINAGATIATWTNKVV